jgi:N-acetylglucosamine-6-phosphate deacetylase
MIDEENDDNTGATRTGCFVATMRARKYLPPVARDENDVFAIIEKRPMYIEIYTDEFHVRDRTGRMIASYQFKAMSFDDAMRDEALRASS